MTPFHNMALMSPDTVAEDVDRHTAVFREAVMSWTLQYDDVLDAEKLHRALARLLEIGNWRKLGGRLRLDVSSLLGLLADETFNVRI